MGGSRQPAEGQSLSGPRAWEHLGALLGLEDPPPFPEQATCTPIPFCSPPSSFFFNRRDSMKCWEQSRGLPVQQERERGTELLAWETSTRDLGTPSLSIPNSYGSFCLLHHPARASPGIKKIKINKKGTDPRQQQQQLASLEAAEAGQASLLAALQRIKTRLPSCPGGFSLPLDQRSPQAQLCHQASPCAHTPAKSAQNFAPSTRALSEAAAFGVSNHSTFGAGGAWGGMAISSQKIQRIRKPLQRQVLAHGASAQRRKG